MKCVNCQADNVATARYCAQCGAPLQQRASRPQPTGKISCGKCGTPNPPDSTFCENCGNRLDRQPRPARTQAQPTRSATAASTAPAAVHQSAGTQEQTQPTSGAWWLLPIFFGIIGGLIGFVVVREKDKKKANGLLILGIVMTAFWIILNIGIGAASFFANF